jgi:Na+/phosphate symporter
MKSKAQNSTLVSLTVFVGLTVIFAVLLFAASGLQEPFAQSILISLGSVIFGTGLVFFLLRMTGRQ